MAINLLVIGDKLKEEGREVVAAMVGVGVIRGVGVEVDGGGVDGATYVREGGQFLEGLGGFERR
ncbi:hypothetical protein Fmac_011034 [Flemingia macrophylla]|uniref:Uncharacterized protein n=1 Tax=Flemingia macrophylla TaxID=520843 RepID=A0ABD1MM47_9FABA